MAPQVDRLRQPIQWMLVDMASEEEVEATEYADRGEEEKNLIF